MHCNESKRSAFQPLLQCIQLCFWRGINNAKKKKKPCNCCVSHSIHSEYQVGLKYQTLSRQLPGLKEGTEPHGPLQGVPQGHGSLTPSESLPDQASIATHKHVSKHKTPTQSLTSYMTQKGWDCEQVLFLFTSSYKPSTSSPMDIIIFRLPN